MLHFIKGIRPSEIDGVACSGGVDSMVLLHFLQQGKSKPFVFFYHHNTETSEKAFYFIRDYCFTNGLEFISEKLDVECPVRRSQEDFWREHRYNFLNKQEMDIATAHHLSDAVETWLFSSFHGNPSLIPTHNKNIVRPLLLSSKEDIMEYAVRNNVPYIEDMTNYDTVHCRNRIRHNIMPEVLKVNPGILKVIKKKYLNVNLEKV